MVCPAYMFTHMASEITPLMRFLHSSQVSFLSPSCFKSSKSFNHPIILYLGYLLCINFVNNSNPLWLRQPVCLILQCPEGGLKPDSVLFDSDFPLPLRRQSCFSEMTNQNQVIPLILRLGKGHPLFPFLQTRLLQCTSFWY